MASKVNQPSGFIKLTNVAFVKYRVDKAKLEIACYKNKAINWRNGVEKDLSEVLQSEEIYENATHGTIAKKEQLSKLFPGMSKNEIIEMILQKGELQVSEKEREVQTENLLKDITNFIAEKTVHPESQRQFSIEQISQAIADIHFNVKQDQPAKKQALLCIQMLQQKYYLNRAQMKIGITYADKYDERVQKLVKELNIDESKIEINNKESEKSIQLTCVIDPHMFRPLIEGLKSLKIQVTSEVIEGVIINKTIQDIDNAGNIELKIRPEWKEGGKNPSLEQKGQVTKKGNKKVGKLLQQQQIQQQLQTNQKQQQQDDEQEENDDEEDLEDDGLKTKNKKQRKKEHARLMKQKQQEEDKKQESSRLQFMLEQQKQQQQNNMLDFSEVNQQLLEEKKQVEIAKKKLNQQGEEEQKKQESANQNQVQKGGKTCTHCKDANFQDAGEFRQHYKTEWHITNVKRKTQALSKLSEQEYQLQILDQQFDKK